MMIMAIAFALQGSAMLDCDSAMTQTDMNQCAAREYYQADRALNAQWVKTAAAMRKRDETRFGDGRPGYFETLLEGQRAWLKYRDAHCRAEGYYARGGSLEPMLVATCKADLTRKRTQDLRDLVTQ